jgi:regulator of RNase E activity RraA
MTSSGAHSGAATVFGEFQKPATIASNSASNQSGSEQMMSANISAIRAESSAVGTAITVHLRNPRVRDHSRGRDNLYQLLPIFYIATLTDATALSKL